MAFLQKQSGKHSPEREEEKEIVFSKTVKAGKRIYYLDVKKDRKDDLFVSITESKKRATGDDGQFLLEKHKIFLYKEDFDKFVEGLEDVVGFIKREQGEAPQREYKEVETVDSAVAEESKSKSFFDKFKF